MRETQTRGKNNKKTNKKNNEKTNKKRNQIQASQKGKHASLKKKDQKRTLKKQRDITLEEKKKKQRSKKTGVNEQIKKKSINQVRQMKENKQEERMSRPQHKKKRRRKQHTVQPKKRGPKKRRQKKRVVYVWWSIGLLASLFGFFLWVFYVSYTVHPVVGTSMDPAVKDGATVLLAKEEPFIRYDVIGFSVKGEDNHFVKRIIGLPGDPIFVAGNRLVIDLEGEGAFTTTYSVTLTETLAKAWQDQTRIPNDCYFVLGDHLQVSKDSRSFGWVKRSSIKGRVQWIQN